MSTAALAQRLQFRTPPFPPHRYGMGRNRQEGVQLNPSYRVLARGSRRMGEQFKRRNIGLVCVKTDDAEITLGMLLRDDEKHQIRICHCVDGRRGIFEIIAVARDRVKRMVGLN